MNSRTNVILVAAAALIAPVIAGCSSGPAPAGLQPGTLPSGTAQITVNDHDLGTFRAVACTSTGDLTTMTTGDEESGSTVVVSNADGLIAKSVEVRNLGGFTGSYHEGLPGGSAAVTLTGKTYLTEGSAEGFDTDKPSFRSKGTFSIKIAC